MMTRQLVPLTATALFRGVDAHHLLKVAQETTIREYSAGHTLHSYGDPSGPAFVILGGTVKVTVFERSGKEAFDVYLGPGALVGVCTLNTINARKETVKSTTPAKVLEIPIERLAQYAREILEVSINLRPYFERPSRTNELMSSVDLTYAVRGPLSPLDSSAIFQGVSASDLKKITEETTVHALPAQQILYERGEPADAVLVMLSGVVSLSTKGWFNHWVRRWRDPLTHFRGPGALLGNVKAIDRMKQSHTAVLRAPSSVLEVKIEQLQRYCAEIPQVQKNLMRIK